VVRRSAKTPMMREKIEEKIAEAFFETNEMAIDPRSGPALAKFYRPTSQMV
jgi:hypothetical protein